MCNVFTVYILEIWCQGEWWGWLPRVLLGIVVLSVLQITPNLLINHSTIQNLIGSVLEVAGA